MQIVRKGGPRSPCLDILQSLERGDAVAADHDGSTSIAILPDVHVVGFRMHLFDSIVYDKIEEHVEAAKSPLNLATALNVDSDALVEESLEFWLRYFRHLRECLDVSMDLYECG